MPRARRFRLRARRSFSMSFPAAAIAASGVAKHRHDAVSNELVDIATVAEHYVFAKRQKLVQ
jgi:hypothetical protein